MSSVDWLSEKVKDEAKVFLYAPVYPFLQRDWMLKMWVFGALAYVPIVNLIIARGWRMDYIHRIGWGKEKVLPSARDVPRFFVSGVYLWLITGVYVSIPVIIIMTLGIGGWIDLWQDIRYVTFLTLDYAWFWSMSTSAYFGQLYTFLVSELIDSAYVFLIDNLYLLIYVPLYRIGMIRFSLTRNLLASHAAILKNIKFLLSNFIDIVLMYVFNIFNFLLIIVVDAALAFSVIGVPLIPIAITFMPFWNTGYEYGLLAQRMVEAEGLTHEYSHADEDVDVMGAVKTAAADVRSRIQPGQS